MSRSPRPLAPLVPVVPLAALALFLLLPASGPSRAAPATQEEPAARVYLPLVLNDATRGDLDPGQPAPSATPTIAPSSEPTASSLPPPTASAPPTSEPPLTPTATPRPLPPIEIDGDWLRTPHYELLSPSPALDKRELGLMMEQFYEQATAYFGAEPPGPERLVGKIFPDRESYVAGLRADGIDASSGDSGGYYSWNTRIFYLHVQPSPHYTRQLTMHEAAHQLQHQAKGCEAPGWWTEGEAEHLGMHTWDGVTLHMRAQPLITLEDYPKSALGSFEDKGEDVGYIVRGERGWTYREAWALVSFVNETLPNQAGDLRQRYCDGEGSAEAWEAVFGSGVTPTTNQRYRAWLEANQQPWSNVWDHVDPVGGDGFLVRSDVNALAHTKERPDALALEMEHLDGGLRAGIVVAYHGSSEFVMLRLNAARDLAVIRVSPGWSWSWLHQQRAPDPLPGAEGRDRMEARVVDEALVILVNGEEVHRLEEPRDLEGRFGLNLEGCEVRMWVRPSG